MNLDQGCPKRGASKFGVITSAIDSPELFDEIRHNALPHERRHAQDGIEVCR